MAWWRRPTAGQHSRFRIVVGVDPRPVSRAAVQWATALASWLEAEVIVVHALDPAPPISRAEVPISSIAAQIAAALNRDWCSPLRDAAIPCRALVREGAPVDVLRDILHTEGPDLLVTGRRVGALQDGRGSTSLGVLAEPLVPTLIVPQTELAAITLARAREPGPPTRRTLVGIDGSAPSLRALDLAVDLAAAGGDVVAVAAVEDSAVFPLGPAAAVTSEGETDAPARMAAMLAAACAPARSRGLHVHTICRRGTAATVLLRSATVVGADLIAVGTRGVGDPDHPRLGSVSRRLVCDSPRAVLVTPGAPATGRAAGTTP